MAPPAKKRRTNAVNAAILNGQTSKHEDSCKLHDDIGRLTSTCNGLKRVDGTRCGNRISSTQTIVRGFLPVRKVHDGQMLQFVQRVCAATAACGHRCGRPCVVNTNLNHVCPEHVDASFDCFLGQLPFELRAMILEYLIPTGPIGASIEPGDLVRVGRRKWRRVPSINPAQGYRLATTLLKVNRMVSCDVQEVLCRSKQRPLEVQISNRSVKVLGKEHLWSPEGDSDLNLRRTDLTSLYAIGLDRFYVLDLSITDTSLSDSHQRGWDRKQLFRLLENLRHVLSAAKMLKVFDEHGGVVQCEGTEAKEIRLILDVVGPKYTQPNPETIIEETFAIINAVFNTFTIVGRVNLYWEVRLKGRTKLCITPWTLTFDSDTMYGADLRERCELAAQSLRLRLWLQSSLAQQRQALHAWTLYQRFCILCKDLIATGSFSKLHGGIHLYWRARCAVECRDPDAITRIISGIWSSWTRRQNAIDDMKTRLSERYAAPVEQGTSYESMNPIVFDQAASEEADPQMLVAAYDLPARDSPPEWAGVTECGSFVYRMVNGRMTYRLKTPHLIRALHDGPQNANEQDLSTPFPLPKKVETSNNKRTDSQTTLLRELPSGRLLIMTKSKNSPGLLKQPH